MKFIVTLILTLFTLHALHADEESLSLVDTEQSISCLVNGTVNAITGDYMESHQDLVITGPEPLTFERFYCSSSYKLGSKWNGWRHNHYNYLTTSYNYIEKEQVGHKYVTYIDATNSSPLFKVITKDAPNFNPAIPATIDLPKNKGLTNLGSGFLSGQTNHKNTQIYFPNPKIAKVITGAGEKREYLRRGDGHELHGVYILQKKEIPSGNKINYSYKDRALDKITISDSSGTKIYNTLFFPNGDEKYPTTSNLPATGSKPHSHSMKVQSNDGRTVEYMFDLETIRGASLLSEVRSSDKPTQNYEYCWDKNHNAKIKCSRRPKGRFISTEYYKLNDVSPKSKKVLAEKDPVINRVKQQMAPVGSGETPIITHIYEYNLNLKEVRNFYHPYIIEGGSTDVYNAYNTKSTYHFNADHRLTSFQKFTANNVAYSTEYINYGAPNTPDETNIICKFLAGPTGIAYARSYIYDNRGNVTQEKHYGNITGKNTTPINIVPNARPVDNGCDCYVKYSTYSTDGLNLLLSEVEPNGRTTKYVYKPNTNLLERKYVCFNNQIIMREFRYYSPEGVLQSLFVDDGSQLELNDMTGVTERKVTHAIIKQEAPGYGLPIVQGHHYTNMKTGANVVHRNIVNTYSKEGRLIKQDHYAGESIFRYSLTWEYDAHGNVLKETNALGQAIYKEYDANDNLIVERDPQLGITKKYLYDCSDRVVRIDEEHADGPTLTIKNKYDYLSNLTNTIDIYGNETSFTYDEFSRLIKTVSTPVEDSSGALIQPVTTKTYDVFGNVTSITDPRGYTTSTKYTINGKPYAIYYPDGSSETFEYLIDGTLYKTTGRNGTTTLHHHDFMGRVIKTEVFSPQNELLSTTSSTYNAFHMTSSTDPEGQTTFYTYDGIGRKATERKNDHLIAYEYDLAGHLYKTKEWYGPDENDFVCKVLEYDILDRVIEERIEDSSATILSKVNYAYDLAGNRSQVIQYTNNESCPTLTEYNSFRKPIRITDALGHETHITYNYDYKNKYGQNVLEVISTDPLGNNTIVIHDIFGRVATTMRKNSLGTLLAKQDHYYDPAGNKTLLRETVFTPNAPEREVLTAWTYDSMGKAIILEEALDLPEHKTTRIVYNNFGEKELVVKPDGNVIRHIYDPLGRLKQYSSSDNSFGYAYEYDKNSRPTCITDLKNNSTNIRTYNENGYLVKETLGNGLTLEYSYDRLGRPTHQRIFDGSEIEYSYDAIHLKTITRLSATQKKYTHTYDQYDLAGHLNTSHPIGNFGELKFAYDKLGRPSQITSKFSNTTAVEFDAVGNLLKDRIQDSVGVKDRQYSYDDLYQLSSETGEQPHQYGYDSLNNRVMKDNLVLTINSLNQLLNDSQATYAYDFNGNMTLKQNPNEKINYTYDALDRLISVETPISHIEYTYDSFNRRLSKTFNNIRTLYLWQGQNEIGSVDAKGKLTEFRLLGLGKRAEIGAAVALEINGITYAPLHDLRGNVTTLIDIKTSKIVETYRYSAFGEEKIFDEDNLEIDSSINPWRFSSKRVDGETQFIYFGRRYYDPQNGRWVTPDPIGFEGGPNLYAYVFNSPLMHFDMYGLEWERWGDKWYYNREAKTTSKKESSGSTERASKDNDSRSERSSRPGFFQSVGYAIAGIGGNIFPVGIRDAFISIGNFLQGNGLEWHSSFRETHSKNGIFKGNGTNVPGHIVYFTEGVFNSEEECLAECAMISEAYGGVDVYYTYNASHGIFMDLLECIVQKLGFIPTNSVCKAVENIQSIFKDIGPNGQIKIVAHSQGGIIIDAALRQICPENCKQINVITCGSGKMISAEELNLGCAINYVSPRDFVPFIGDPVGYFDGRFNRRDDIKFIDSNGYYFIDHSFQKSYGKAIDEDGLKFKQKHGLL